jgi:DNA-binding MarR family transcriptional regulator
MNQKQLKSFYPLTLCVRRLFHKLGHGVAALHQNSDISVGMRAVLESIIDGGPQTVPHMARIRPVTRQHVQALVNELLEGGYVEYIDNPAHKRSKLVNSTKRGMRVFEKMRAIETEAFKRAKIEISPEEFEAARKVLSALIAAFESTEWRLVIDQLSQTKET